MILPSQKGDYMVNPSSRANFVLSSCKRFATFSKEMYENLGSLGWLGYVGWSSLTHGTTFVRIKGSLDRMKVVYRTLRYHDGDDNGNVKKAIGWMGKQQLCTCITLFCTFHCHHCTTTTEKYVISRFMEDENKRLLNFLSLSELEYVF